MEQALLAWLLRALYIVLSKTNMGDFIMVFNDIFVNLVIYSNLNECKSQYLKWMNHSQTNQMYSPVKVSSVG